MFFQKKERGAPYRCTPTYGVFLHSAGRDRRRVWLELLRGVAKTETGGASSGAHRRRWVGIAGAADFLGHLVATVWSWRQLVVLNFASLRGTRKLKLKTLLWENSRALVLPASTTAAVNVHTLHVAASFAGCVGAGCTHCVRALSP